MAITTKNIGITFGDVAGIGPEIIYKSLSSKSLASQHTRYILFGDKKIFQKIGTILSDYKPCCAYIFYDDLIKRKSNLSFSKKMKGKTKKEFGQASIKWINEAFVAYKNGIIDCLVTAPINKKSCHQAGFKFKGHTDYLTHLSKRSHTSMAFYSKKMKIILVSHHISLKKSIHLLTTAKVSDAISNAIKFSSMLKIKKPNILVSGLNPHAGENGAFGQEEKEIIQPAIKKISLDFHGNITGPISPDIVFQKALKIKDSIVIAMNHDHGLIPFKMIAFDSGVNVTIGMDLIRTSPDHGTAFDISWQGIASATSMIEAIKLAKKLAK